MKTESVAIIGMGAIGRLVTKGLLDAGIKCYFLDNRNPEEDTFMRYTVKNMDGSFQYLSIPSLPATIIPDLIILCTKSYHTIQALSGLNKRIPSQIPLVVLQNGMGNDEQVRSCISNPLIMATATLGALRLQKEVICTGKGEIYFDGKFHLEQLTSPEIPWVATKDIHSRILLKLAINAVINPLTALLDIKNGEILKIPEKVDPLIHEIYCIIGERLSETDEDYLKKQILTVAENTAENYSSMHQDLKHSRKTEAESILGYLVREAARQNLPCPLITNLLLKIKMRENNNESTNSCS